MTTRDLLKAAEWECYEVTFEMPLEHYGEFIFKRDLAGHWFMLRLPELPTEHTAAGSGRRTGKYRLVYNKVTKRIDKVSNFDGLAVESFDPQENCEWI